MVGGVRGGRLGRAHLQHHIDGGTGRRRNRRCSWPDGSDPRLQGVAVGQALRKTTGDRPQFGALQMKKALLPALYAHEQELERDLERALDQISREFDRRGV